MKTTTTIIILLLSFMLLPASAKENEDPNYLRVEDGKILVGVTCPYKEKTKGVGKFRIILEAVISDPGKSKLSMDEKQTQEFESSLREYLSELESFTRKALPKITEDIQGKVKEILNLEKTPKLKLKRFEVTSSRR